MGKPGAEARWMAAAKSRQGAERGGRRGGEVRGVSEPFRQRIIGTGGGKMRKTKESRCHSCRYLH